MTDEQLDELERLLKERDEARASLQAFQDRVKASGESLDFGAIGKKYGQEYSSLANACARAVWAFQDAATVAVPALVVEVRRLTRVAKERCLADGTTPGEAATGDDLVDRLRGIYTHPEGERRFHSSSINREAADRIRELSRDAELAAALVEAEALRDRYSNFALHHANGWGASFWNVDERGNEVPGVSAIGTTAAEAVRRAVARVKETNP